MSINWNFEKDFIGTVSHYQGVDKEDCKYNIYACNGLFVMLSETEKNYFVVNFAVDEQHFKNCLKDEIYKDFYSWNFIDCKTSRKIAKLLVMYNNYPMFLQIGYDYICKEIIKGVKNNDND